MPKRSFRKRVGGGRKAVDGDVGVYDLQRYETVG